ncbi:uncharacterized protein LOC132255368 [Phlebotomus argentipes]|uniref:uncharacterized protein LOC132255368 n=1 Tax=Phlebotomus argentipes TaxID=94469 RepID=UPI0028937F21|nr:uncharacterized protein LOC132255368 [Phlebotomus argentipes]
MPGEMKFLGVFLVVFALLAVEIRANGDTIQNHEEIDCLVYNNCTSTATPSDETTLEITSTPLISTTDSPNPPGSESKPALCEFSLNKYGACFFCCKEKNKPGRSCCRTNSFFCMRMFGMDENAGWNHGWEYSWNHGWIYEDDYSH